VEKAIVVRVVMDRDQKNNIKTWNGIPPATFEYVELPTQTFLGLGGVIENKQSRNHGPNQQNLEKKAAGLEKRGS